MMPTHYKKRRAGKKAARLMRRLKNGRFVRRKKR